MPLETPHNFSNGIKGTLEESKNRLHVERRGNRTYCSYDVHPCCL